MPKPKLNISRIFNFNEYPGPVQTAEFGNAAFVTGTAVALMFIVWAVLCLPANMDEFCAYHPLACMTCFKPLSSLHVYSEGCDKYLTVLLGHFVHRRAYGYIGNLSALIYLPFFLLWKSVYSHYLEGLLFAVGFYAFFLSLHRQRASWFVFLLCFFPITFQMIHDTGPVRFSLLAFPMGALLFRNGVTKKGMGAFARLALIAILVALAVEDKPFFLLLLPGYGFYLAAFSEKGDWNLKALGAAVFLLASLLVLLFSQTDLNTHLSYFQVIVGLRAIDQMSVRHYLADLISFLSCPAMYAHRIYGCPSCPYVDEHGLYRFYGLAKWGLICSAPPMFYMWAYIGAAPRPMDRRRTFLALSLCSMAGVFLLSRSEWAGHHFVFLMVPILSAFIDGAMGRRGRPAAWILISMAASSIFTLVLMKPAFDSGWERSAIFDYLDLDTVASHSVVNFSTQGMYYQQALYGPPGELVTTMDTYGMGDSWYPDARGLLRTAVSLQRDVLDVCVCDPDTVRLAYGLNTTVSEIKLGSEPWRVFKISLKSGVRFPN